LAISGSKPGASYLMNSCGAIFGRSLKDFRLRIVGLVDSVGGVLLYLVRSRV
jgi:hypothetical protein